MDTGIRLLCCAWESVVWKLVIKKNAVEYLLRAYMMEGKEIFEPDEDGEDDGQKYFDFLKTHVDHIE